jgi:hypothetical protein
MKPTRQDTGAASKSTYVRKTVGLVPTNLPFKRVPEGSILTGTSVTTGNGQPEHRTKPQSIGKGMGSAD